MWRDSKGPHVKGPHVRNYARFCKSKGLGLDSSESYEAYKKELAEQGKSEKQINRIIALVRKEIRDSLNRP